MMLHHEHDFVQHQEMMPQLVMQLQPQQLVMQSQGTMRPQLGTMPPQLGPMHPQGPMQPQLGTMPELRHSFTQTINCAANIERNRQYSQEIDKVFCATISKQCANLEGGGVPYKTCMKQACDSRCEYFDVHTEYEELLLNQTKEKDEQVNQARAAFNEQDDPAKTKMNERLSRYTQARIAEQQSPESGTFRYSR